MSDTLILVICVGAWGAGFFSSWLYSILTIRRLERTIIDLQAALHCAGETIMEQGEEIHGILVHAHKCESEFIN